MSVPPSGALGNFATYQRVLDTEKYRMAITA